MRRRCNGHSRPEHCRSWPGGGGGLMGRFSRPSNIIEATMFKATTYLFACSMFLCPPSWAKADDCVAAAHQLTAECPAISDGQFNFVPECKFNEAKTNFLWSSRDNPGAVTHFREIFDTCNTPDLSTIEKNIAAAIISQMHNMNALCSIYYCTFGDMQGFLLVERSHHRLYEGAPAKTSRPTNRCAAGYILSEGICQPFNILLDGHSD